MLLEQVGAAAVLLVVCLIGRAGRSGPHSVATAVVQTFGVIGLVLLGLVAVSFWWFARTFTF